MQDQTESDLINRCRQGDEKAWDELFDKHYAAAGRFIFQLGSFSAEDVEEICQDVFLSVIRHLDSFLGNSHFQTWVFRIAANKARDYRQKQTALKRGGANVIFSLQAGDLDPGLNPEPPSDSLGPDAVLINQERVALLRQAIDQLDAPCREIIELRYFGEMSYDQLSTTLGLNPKTVSSRLSKCLDKLEDLTRVLFEKGKPTLSPSN